MSEAARSLASRRDDAEVCKAHVDYDSAPEEGISGSEGDDGKSETVHVKFLSVLKILSFKVPENGDLQEVWRGQVYQLGPLENRHWEATKKAYFRLAGKGISRHVRVVSSCG